MKQCPSCGKSISEYASTCPNCKTDLTQKIVLETDRPTIIPTKEASAARKPNMKAIVAVVFAVIALIGVVYISQPLHGNDKIAYDLISNSSYFKNATNIELQGGTAGVNGSGDKYATVTIAYTDYLGNRIVGHYRIEADEVEDIQKIIDAAKKVKENYTGGTTEEVLAVQRAGINYEMYSRLLNVSEYNNELNYEKITEMLNK